MQIKQSYNDFFVSFTNSINNLQKIGVYQLAPFFALDNFRILRPYIFIRYDIELNVFTFNSAWDASESQRKSNNYIEINPLSNMDTVYRIQDSILPLYKSLVERVEQVNSLSELDIQDLLDTISYDTFKTSLSDDAICNLFYYKTKAIPAEFFFRNSEAILPMDASSYPPEQKSIKSLLLKTLNGVMSENTSGNLVDIDIDDSVTLTKRCILLSSSYGTEGMTLPRLYLVLNIDNEKPILTISSKEPNANMRYSKDFYWRIGNTIPLRDVIRVFTRTHFQKIVFDFATKLKTLRESVRNSSQRDAVIFENYRKAKIDMDDLLGEYNLFNAKRRYAWE